MKKLRILFDATILANGLEKDAGRSGIFFTAYQVAKRLIKSPDISFTFYCKKSQQAMLYSLDDYKKIPCYPSLSYFGKISSQCHKNKLMAKNSQKNLNKIFWHYCMFIMELLDACLSIYSHKDKNENSYDVFFSPIFPISIESKAQYNKIYILLHDTIPLLYPEYYPKMRKGHYWFANLVSQLKVNPAYHAFANSNNTKEDFLKFVPELKPEQITVTPLACDEKFQPSSKEETLKSLTKYHLPTDKKYVFSLCSLEPRKNLIRAVKTFIQFIQKHNIDDLVFILGGGHWEDFIGKLNAEIEGLGHYKDKIIKAGYIDDEDLAPLYSGAEWFVYTSQYEGFGLPPLEAMACGCPVITSNNSSLPEVVGDAGLMIDWDSDEQHIKAYEDYYFHPELRKEMRQKGLERAKQFSWDKTVDLMIKEMSR